MHARRMFSAGCLEVIATTGDARLGGDDWDRCFMDWALDQKAHPAARSAVRSAVLTACMALPHCCVRVLRALEQMQAGVDLHDPHTNDLIRYWRSWMNYSLSIQSINA